MKRKMIFLWILSIMLCAGMVFVDGTAFAGTTVYVYAKKPNGQYVANFWVKYEGNYKKSDVKYGRTDYATIYVTNGRKLIRVKGNVDGYERCGGWWINSRGGSQTIEVPLTNTCHEW